MHEMKTPSRMRVIILHNITMFIKCPCLIGLHSGVGSQEKTQQSLNTNILMLF